MKVLFTGANGALGKKYTQSNPDTIPVYVRYNDGPGLQDLANQIKEADVLIHAGANLRPKTADDAIRDNAILPLDIIDMAGKINKDLHIILISTMSLLSENCEPKRLKDMTYYAASKYIMEEMCQKLTSNPLTIVRFSSIFYEDPNKDGLSRIIYNAKFNKSIVAADCRRDFVPLWVLCRWLNKLCGNKTWYNRTINLASGKSVNMVDVAHHLVKKYDVSFHHTSLPEYADICYRFSAEEPQSLEKITFDIYKIIDEYYESLGRK